MSYLEEGAVRTAGAIVDLLGTGFGHHLVSGHTRTTIGVRSFIRKQPLLSHRNPVTCPSQIGVVGKHVVAATSIAVPGRAQSVILARRRRNAPQDFTDFKPF